MKQLRGWVVGFLIMVFIAIPGCGVFFNSSVKGTGPHPSGTRVVVQSQTTTYAMPVGASLPASVLAQLQAKSTIPVMVPASLPHFTRPSSQGYSLAVNTDITPNSYNLTLFWRPTGSQTSDYDIADLVGYISASNKPRVQRFVPTKEELREEISIPLPGGTTAVEYRNAGFANRNVITWSNHNWTYLTYGLPLSAVPMSSTSLGMAQELAADLAMHGIILPNVKQGFVQASLLTDRPLVVVSWTYNNREWYTISLQNMSQSVGAARAVVELHS